MSDGVLGAECVEAPALGQCGPPVHEGDGLGAVEVGHQIVVLNAGPIVRVTAGTAEIEGPGMADGRWTHAAVTYDGSTVELFVDNTSAGTAEVQLDTTAFDCVVGDAFDGMVDELRVYGMDRTASDIGADARQELEGDEPGLLLYWTFNTVTVSGAGERVQNEATATGPATDGVTEGSDTTPGPVQSDAW